MQVLDPAARRLQKRLGMDASQEIILQMQELESRCLVECPMMDLSDIIVVQMQFLQRFQVDKTAFGQGRDIIVVETKHLKFGQIFDCAPHHAGIGNFIMAQVHRIDGRQIGECAQMDPTDAVRIAIQRFQLMEILEESRLHAIQFRAATDLNSFQCTQIDESIWRQFHQANRLDFDVAQLGERGKTRCPFQMLTLDGHRLEFLAFGQTVERQAAKRSFDDKYFDQTRFEAIQPARCQPLHTIIAQHQSHNTQRRKETTRQRWQLIILQYQFIDWFVDEFRN